MLERAKSFLVCSVMTLLEIKKYILQELKYQSSNLYKTAELIENNVRRL